MEKEFEMSYKGENAEVAKVDITLLDYMNRDFSYLVYLCDYRKLRDAYVKDITLLLQENSRLKNEIKNIEKK
jgi:hypothetical protein